MFSKLCCWCSMRHAHHSRASVPMCKFRARAPHRMMTHMTSRNDADEKEREREREREIERVLAKSQRDAHTCTRIN